MRGGRVAPAGAARCNPVAEDSSALPSRLQKLAIRRAAQPCHQNPRRKYDPIDIEVSPVTGMPEKHGSDCGKGNKLSIKDREFTPVPSAGPHSPQAENHNRSVR